MITFFIGLAILLVGGYFYSGLAVKVFGPDDRKTPCYTKADGVDFVPMPLWKNSLINLLNIAGTGPILGPIQGILFGPIAFITIPLGNVFDKPNAPKEIKRLQRWCNNKFIFRSCNKFEDYQKGIKQ